MAVIYKCFTYAYTLYVSIRPEKGFPSAHFYYTNHYPSWFINDMIICNACVNVDDILNDFGISLLYQLGSFVYIS